MTTTTQPPLLRNAALSLPIAVVVGALWGVEHAFAAAVCGAVVLGNLWMLSVLAPRVVHSVSRGESPALWVGMLGLKFVVLTAIVLGMARYFPPLGVALGFLPMVLGTLATGVQMAQEEALHEAEPTPDSTSDEG